MAKKVTPAKPTKVPTQPKKGKTPGMPTIAPGAPKPKPIKPGKVFK
jgi:hypothetical protein